VAPALAFVLESRGGSGLRRRRACLAESTVHAFVDDALPETARRAAEEHIDACSGCRALLAELGRALCDAETQGAPAPVACGRYTLREQLGAGASGVVYAAEDAELGRRVALKVVHATDAAPVVREAKAMARIAHPNVITVFDVGTWEDAVFLTMELVDGGTLRDFARGRRAWPEVLAAYAQAGRGLAAAHAVGLVHRDFKPENVLVGKDGRVRVCDFGLARALDANDTAEPTGCLVGTPAYMAPEQLRGERAGVRADVFSFSVALHEALCGLRPFAGRTLLELRASIEAGRPRTSNDWERVPRGVRRVIRRGLEARPDDRWPTTTAMVDALEHAARWKRNAPRRSGRVPGSQGVGHE
jgi:serine/threonine protein kinase